MAETEEVETVETDDAEPVEETEAAEEDAAETEGDEETETVEEGAEDDAAEEGAEQLESAEDAEDELPSEIETLRMQLETERQQRALLEQRERKARKDHDELTGKLGPRIDELTRENERLRSGEREDERETPRVTRTHDPVIETMRSELAVLRKATAETACRTAAEQFMRKFPIMEKLTSEVKPHIERDLKAYEEQVADATPEEAATLTQGLLMRAMLSAIEDRRKTAKGREMKQADRLNKEKVRATPAGVGPSKPKAKSVKSPEQMTEKEMEAEFRRQGRKGF